MKRATTVVVASDFQAERPTTLDRIGDCDHFTSWTRTHTHTHDTQPPTRRSCFRAPYRGRSNALLPPEKSTTNRHRNNHSLANARSFAGAPPPPHPRAGATPPITPARGCMARPAACALLPPPRLRPSYSYYEGRRGTGARLGTSRPPRPCSRWSCCRGPRSSLRHYAPAPPPKSGVRSGLRP